MYLKFADLPWVFVAFVEVNGSYFNTNGFTVNTVIFSNTVILSNTMILFMEGIPFAIFQYCPALSNIAIKISNYKLSVSIIDFRV